MTALPAVYDWLNDELGPKMLREAIRLYGTIELPDNRDSPTILSWAKELSMERVYSHDSIPWCGLFMALCATRAGFDPPDSPLWALNWAKWGTPVERPMLGDVLTFKRQGGGHVAMYVGEDSASYHIIGGNQSDSVSITRKPRGQLFQARRAKWKSAQPSNVRVVKLRQGGAPLASKES